MTRRLRVAHVIVQPVLVWDDGENLSPGPEAQPRQLPLSAMRTFDEDLAAQLADVPDPLDAPPE